VVKALITVESFDPSTPLRERCSKRLGDCYTVEARQRAEGRTEEDFRLKTFIAGLSFVWT